jgi:BirA family transcriptional regulator, biotin operon repressor / biotin---[acetyl-CoA-carboxylase] ligase
MQLHSAAVAVGYRLAAYETLSSTNAEALTQARGGERGSLWIVAREQTAGRGRRGNEWVSWSGNLYATLLLVDPAPAERAPELSFVAALGLHDAILDRAPDLRSRLALKWPNDVLCGGAKLAGILIEGERPATEPAVVVAIGIGVNCRHHPAQTSYPATDLKAAGADVSAESLFEALSAAMVRRLGQWRRGAGFDGIRADWISRAAGLADEMRVRLPGTEVVGRGEGLDAHGRLLLRLADGSLQAVAAGDVFPLTGVMPLSATPRGRVE